MTTDRRTLRKRLSSGRAVSALVLGLAVLAAAGCTSTTDSSDTTAGSNPTTTVAAPESATTTAPAGDVSQLLSKALEAYEDGYRFEAEAIVGSNPAAIVTGFVIAESAQMTVVSGDGSVTYLITPDISWIRIDGGEWEEVDSDGPLAPPLAGLAQPDSLVISNTKGDDVSAIGIYRGESFGSDDPVELALDFANGLLVSASYTIGDASVKTTFSPLDGDVIENPAG